MDSGAIGRDEPLEARPRILLVEPEARARTLWLRELSRSDVGADVLAFDGAATALRVLATSDTTATVAFLEWSLEAPDDRVLVSVLRSMGAQIVAMLPRDRWDGAAEAQRDGADDVLLTPCPPRALTVRAMLALAALRRARPAPWHRPRVALKEALAHPIGGEVVIRAPARSARILVSHGRVAWVHDDGDRGALGDRLREHGVQLGADELESVVAECRRTGQHLVDVLSSWRLAERDTVTAAMRAIVDRRLGAALSFRDGAALFIPARTTDRQQLGFSTDELRLAPGTIPPPSAPASQPPTSVDPALRARGDDLVREVLAIEGCVAAAVMQYGGASIVSAHGARERLAIAWTLGGALDALDDPRADALAADEGRGHLARRVPGTSDCFVYAAIDLAATTLALARRSLAAAVERAATQR